MIIGVDFDNTIVNYGNLFYEVAVERGLIDNDGPMSKTAIRDGLRNRGDEAAWTEMQGHIYGVAIERAEPFDGVIEFFTECRRRSVPVFIVSHRTKKPYAGPDVDLHTAARNWIAANLRDNTGSLIKPDDGWFESTRISKMQRIASLGCTYFIDDLPEFLSDPAFPANVERLWFAPENEATAENALRRYASWHDIMEALL